MSSLIDLEAQQRAEVEGAEKREIDNLGAHSSNPTGPLRSVSAGQDINEEARPAVSQAEGSKRGDTPEKTENNITADGPAQAEAQIPADTIPTLGPGPRNTTSDSKSEEPRMIGDFDGSANEFWKLYRDEAKSHDDATISTLKDGMDSALIFAGLFSAVLTAFVVDSKQNLKQSPADETVYYLRQHSIILSQISVQLSSIAPQTIPSTPSPDLPSFKPLTSDIRVNVFWFMALVFSVLAAFLAIFVQQWVRNYMHVFQRYGDSLKSSRLRQYLYEGCERWNMPKVAEAVPGFLHVSLFLFFAGLVDSLLNTNTKVALSTIVPIGISGLLYIFMIFAPIIYPQSPYQNLFSRILWYVIQKSRGRRFRDHGSDGEMKSVSANMAKGQMQLAMQETTARKSRDVWATRWLIDNLTEDAEMERFLLALPGSFNTDWGTEVWKRVGECHESEDLGQDTTVHELSASWSMRSVVRPITHLVTSRHPPTHHNIHARSTTAQTQGEDVLHELSTRVARSVETCKNRGLFANDDLWRKRARACVEATASLVCCANAKPDWFGDILKLLGEIGNFEKIRELSLAGTDQLFVMRWTCLSLLAIRPLLEEPGTRHYASATVTRFARQDDSGNHDALATARMIDKTLKKARNCLIGLYYTLPETGDLTEEVKEILRGDESVISELERINVEADSLNWADSCISEMRFVLDRKTYRITSQFPGVLDEFDFDSRAPIPFSHLAELSRDPSELQFLRPRQTLKVMCSLGSALRNILEGQGPGDADAYKELMDNLKDSSFVGWSGDEMQRQLLHMQDLVDGGGLGYTVELFFLTLSRQLSTSSSNESHSALYTGTFRAITSHWSKYEGSLGTQKVLINIAISRRGDFAYRYPACIVDEFLSLLEKIFKAQTGPHIDNARQQFESLELGGSGKFRERLLKVLTQGQSSAS